jgi:hypothetical protein
MLTEVLQVGTIVTHCAREAAVTAHRDEAVGDAIFGWIAPSSSCVLVTPCSGKVRSGQQCNQKAPIFRISSNERVSRFCFADGALHFFMLRCQLTEIIASNTSTQSST